MLQSAYVVHKSKRTLELTWKDYKNETLVGTDTRWRLLLSQWRFIEHRILRIILHVSKNSSTRWLWQSNVRKWITVSIVIQRRGQAGNKETETILPHTNSTVFLCECDTKLRTHGPIGATRTCAVGHTDRNLDHLEATEAGVP